MNHGRIGICLLDGRNVFPRTLMHPPSIEAVHDDNSDVQVVYFEPPGKAPTGEFYSRQPEEATDQIEEAQYQAAMGSTPLCRSTLLARFPPTMFERKRRQKTALPERRGGTRGAITPTHARTIPLQATLEASAAPGSSA